MAHYQVILAYDGTQFHGSQRQAEVRTVQSVVETALRKLNWSGKSVLFAGRTDAGVHASGQVLAFDLEWNHPSENLLRAMNALLPADAAVRAIKPGSPDFHPRYNALSRTYRYQIFYQPVRDPLRERYSWRVWPAPGFDRLQSAASAFLGIHDFAAYGRPTSPGGSTIRALTRAGWQRDGDALTFEVTANAFLYHMVRRLVYVQIAVGQGKLTRDDIHQHLQSPQEPPIQGLAPPHGLTLIGVEYPPENSENDV